MKNVILAEPNTIALFGMGTLLLLLLLTLIGAIIFLIVLFTRKSRKPIPPSVSPVVPSTQIIPRRCPQCGAELKPDVSEGLCPACLLQRGIATEGGLPPGTPPFIPPTIPDLAKLFPQLEIIELIGHGGMGAVYKARQPALDRFVALKILAPRPGGDLDFASRFTREARALARLTHPNIVGVYDFGRAELLLGQDASQRVPTTPVHYFIMEYVDGPNLRQVEQAGKLSSREALEIIPQICTALQFAHDEGIVHRDIKPENILLDKKGRVKIADFGLAKILGQEPKDLRLTGARDIMGTPHYMAPEQMEKPQEVDHRADIYSLGVVFYEMLTGELPLGKFQAPSQKVQVDVRLDEVVLRSLAREPELRYQNVSEVKTRVETIASTDAPAAAPAVSAGEILARDYVLNIRSCLRRGWALVRNDFWPLVGMSAFVLVAMAAAASFEVVLSSGKSAGYPQGKTSILGLLLTGPLFGGLYLYFLKKIRGETASVETAFTGFRQPFPHLVLGSFLAGLLTALGFVCLLIPGIYLLVAWILVIPLIADRRLEFWPAMQLSRKLVTKHWWKIFGFLIVLGLINLVGILACGFGLFITFPVTFAALAYAYEDITSAVKSSSKASLSTAKSPFQRGVLAGLGVSLGVIILATTITFLMPESYVGIARVELAGASPQKYDPYLVQTELEVIESSVVLKPVADSLNLGGRWKKMFSAAGRTLPDDEVVELMKQQLTLQPVRNTSIIEVQFYSQSPKEAAEIANKISEVYCAMPPGHRGEIIDRATVPMQPIRPNRPLNLFIGVVMGSGIGIFTGVAVGLVAFLRRRAALRATSPPTIQKPDHFWRRFAVVMACVISIPIIIAIIGLLAAVAIPNFVRARQQSQQNAAQQWTQEGWQLWQDHKLDQAAAKFRQAVQLTPDKADAWNGLGWATFNAGKSQEAETAFQKAISLDTNQPGALNGLGQIYLSQGKYDQAETYLLKAAPQAPAAWYGLTRLYLLEGKFDQAETWAQKMVDSGQADETAKRMLEAARQKKLNDGLRLMIEPRTSNPAPAKTLADINDLTKAATQAWHARVELLRQRLEQNPQAGIPELKFLTDYDWLEAAKDDLKTDADFRRALNRLRVAGETHFIDSQLQPALKIYVEVNHDQFPTNLAQLQPFFQPPVDEAILQRYEIVPHEKVPDAHWGGDWVVTQKSPVDKDYDRRPVVGAEGGWGRIPF